MKNKFKGQRVLIFGLGLNQGGVGSAQFFAKQGAEVKVTDLKSKEALKPSIDQLKSFPHIEYFLDGHRNEDIDWADLIIKNPAIKPGNSYIDYALAHGKQVEQDMGIFLNFVKPQQIIGITGTKGKSTSVSLIYEVLKGSQKDVVLAGNIGTSVLETIPYIKESTLVVLELSSFQLEAFEQYKVSPHWAMITNIYSDHLNYYKTMDEYISAKRIIGKCQTNSDYLFLRKNDLFTNKEDFLKYLNGKIIYFSKDDLPKDFHPTLVGEHNLENIAAAYSLTNTFGLDEKNILDVLSQFKGIPFRMELIKVWHGVKIYNDTTATGPDAGMKALQTLPNSILIAGGMNKNMPYQEYVKVLEKFAKRVFFLIGDSTDEIRRLMKKKELIAGTYDDFEKLLADVKSTVKPGDTILFSPAATSFNLFQNEFDRGRKFNTAVEKVFGAETS